MPHPDAQIKREINFDVKNGKGLMGADEKKYLL